MGIARERVVPPLGEGAWRRYALVGVVVGVAISLAFCYFHEDVVRAIASRLRGVARGGPLAWEDETRLCLLLVTLGLPLLAILRLTQRWSATLGFAGAFASTFGLVSVVYNQLSGSDGGADRELWLVLPTVWDFATVLPLMSLAAVVLRVLVRTLLVRTVERSSDMCGWCGYTAGRADTALCSECGRPMQPPRYRMNWLIVLCNALLGRAGWCVLICGAVLLSLGWRPVAGKTIPSARFFAAFSGARHATIFPSGYGLARLPSVWVPSPTQNDRGIRVTFEPAHDGRGNRMAAEVVGTFAQMFPLGAAHIVANLNTAQTEWVLRHNLPRELVDALYAKAAEIAWMPASAPRGEWEVKARDEWFAE